MVRKIIILVLICLVLLSAFGGAALAADYTVYQNGNISTTYLTYFRDTLPNVSLNDDYVVFRAGENSYMMYTGDLEEDFTGSAGTIYHYYSVTESWTTTYYYESFAVDSFSLTVGDSIIYSNVGDRPQLEGRGEQVEKMQLLIVSVGVLLFLILRIFNGRNRRF